jgi:hypothetical protein
MNVSHYAGIGLAVSFVILFIGGILLRDAGDGPLSALGLVAFFSAFAVFHFLDERAKRRSRGGQ